MENLNNLRYADDIVLIAESGEQLQKLLDTVVLESGRMGLSLNVKEMECMVISKKSSNPKCNLDCKANLACFDRERVKYCCAYGLLSFLFCVIWIRTEKRTFLKVQCSVKLLEVKVQSDWLTKLNAHLRIRTFSAGFLQQTMSKRDSLCCE
ncbi:retrovirus-related pol polyprotein from type-1 retrotransposable element r2 [Plakobranchus ocellatus]|uniref:Retrovirus-related pol polyprotein from type-1 retrotransposable element r2 n=1 Tax=Plakobranchus ocellatus TaxID=259542 RepID=A0AAV3XU08_9GAST|nr:retrovirus-related pol polyprotein from type-1 retrotransposable element r2 [Plakobranchus ocellatus]